MKYFIRYILFTIIVITIVPLMVIKSCNYHDQFENNNMLINVYFHKEKVTKTIPLEEYLIGVVAAEMPVEFEFEALRAQAVAARTYALGRVEGLYGYKGGSHLGADVCTDSTHCQAWLSNQHLEKTWTGVKRIINLNKIKNAVRSTKGLVLVYDNKIINPLFHSNSGGITEDVVDVWSVNQCPYLKSVKSPGDELSPDFKTEYIFTISELNNLMKKDYENFQISDTTQILITDISPSKRIKKLKLGNIELKGTELRKTLNLRSTKFKIESLDKKIKITTWGNGHGVGMSQWGANSMAKSGIKFNGILQHYYSSSKIVLRK